MCQLKIPIETSYKTNQPINGNWIIPFQQKKNHVIFIELLKRHGKI